jgi:hypothetical protein
MVQMIRQAAGQEQADDNDLIAAVLPNTFVRTQRAIF